MRSCAPTLAGLASFMLWGGLQAQAPSDIPGNLATSGRYDDAIEAYEDALSEGAGVAARRGLIRTLAEVGRYEDAIQVGRSAPGADAASIANALGEVLYKTGRVEAAREAFTAAIEARAPDATLARLNLAVHKYEYGDRAGALADFDAFIDVYNDAQQLPAEDLLAVGVAVEHLGIQNGRLYQDALQAYDEATAANPDDFRAQLRVGRLFLDKFNGPDADAAFKAILLRNSSHPDALLGLAQAMQFNGVPGVMEQIEAALEVNPNLVQARVMLGLQHLSVGNHDDARREAELALEVNPVSLEALTLLASSHYLLGEGAAYERIKSQITQLSPQYPDMFNTIADMAVQSRRYREAVELAEQAVKLDPLSWRGWGLLGINQLRLGEVEAARTNVETAFQGDQANPWFKNTLDLMDTFGNYETIEDETFLLVLHDREAEVLRPYIEEMALRSFEALRDRYGAYTPPLPVRIEVYPSHADFSVRTVGLAGIGALGVTFGSVVAMDSPSARPLGEFNWASTLWHEMAHVFHLGMSNHAVPRWFSEGLAVHEQRQASPSWGFPTAPSFIRAYNEGLVLPVSQMDNGFMRPQYPEQVLHSYYVASLVFEYIEGRWGFDPIVAMLHGYGEGRSTEEMVAEFLDIEMEELDQSFDEFLQVKLERPLKAVRDPRESTPPQGDPLVYFPRIARENPGSFAAQMGAGRALFDAGQTEDAEQYFRTALQLFPTYAGADGPFWYLAQIHEGRGELEQAANALTQLNGLNENHYHARLKEADVREEIGDAGGAANALDGAVTIYPYEIELHERLASLNAGLGNLASVVRERRAVVALDPVDRAEALYRLGRAQLDVGDLTGARRSTLDALEIAPTFDAALDLLLEIRARSGTASGTRSSSR